jgi:hypothetical protein
MADGTKMAEARDHIARRKPKNNPEVRFRFLFYFLFWAALGFEFRASCLLGRHSYHLESFHKPHVQAFITICSHENKFGDSMRSTLSSSQGMHLSDLRTSLH